MNIIQFIEKYRITIACKSIDSRDDGLMADMSRHWECTLKRPCEGRRAKTMKIAFSQGSAHKSEPTAYDILSCVLSDISSLTGSNGFEGWADDLGYDSDSIAHKKIYKALLKQHDKVISFLENGPDDSAYLAFIGTEDDGDTGDDSYEDPGNSEVESLINVWESGNRGRP